MNLGELSTEICRSIEKYGRGHKLSEIKISSKKIFITNCITDNPLEKLNLQKRCVDALVTSKPGQMQKQIEFLTAKVNRLKSSKKRKHKTFTDLKGKLLDELFCKSKKGESEPIIE